MRKRVYIAAASLVLAAISAVPGFPSGILLLVMAAPFYLDPGTDPRNALRFGA